MSSYRFDPQDGGRDATPKDPSGSGPQGGN